MNPRLPPPEHRHVTVVYGVLAIVLILVIMQLWLLTATMHAWLGGDADVIVPGALASLVCLGLNLGLLRFLNSLNS